MQKYIKFHIKSHDCVHPNVELSSHFDMVESSPIKIMAYSKISKSSAGHSSYTGYYFIKRVHISSKIEEQLDLQKPFSKCP